MTKEDLLYSTGVSYWGAGTSKGRFQGKEHGRGIGPHQASKGTGVRSVGHDSIQESAEGVLTAEMGVEPDGKCP